MAPPKKPLRRHLKKGTFVIHSKCLIRQAGKFTRIFVGLAFVNADGRQMFFAFSQDISSDDQMMMDQAPNTDASSESFIGEDRIESGSMEQFMGAGKGTLTVEENGSNSLFHLSVDYRGDQGKVVRFFNLSFPRHHRDLMGTTFHGRVFKNTEKEFNEVLDDLS